MLETKRSQCNVSIKDDGTINFKANLREVTKMQDYNVLEEIENLIDKGYSEEHASEVAMFNYYSIPLEDMVEH